MQQSDGVNNTVYSMVEYPYSLVRVDITTPMPPIFPDPIHILEDFHGFADGEPFTGSFDVPDDCTVFYSSEYKKNIIYLKF